MRKTKLLIYVLIFFSFFLFSKINSIEDLQNKLKTSSGNERIKVLNRLSKEYISKSPLETIKYAKQALILSKKANNLKAEAVALKYIAIGNRDSNNNEEAIKYYKKAVELFMKIGDKKSSGPCYGNIGMIYYAKNDFNKAIEYLKKAKKQFQETENLRAVAATFNNMGAVYWDLGNLKTSLYCHFKGLKIDENLGNKFGIANNLNSIGNVYSRLKNHKLAIKYYTKAKKIFENLNNKRRLAICISNTGAAYESLGNNSRALQLYKESLKIREKIKDKRGISISLNNIGVVYRNLKKYNEALKYYNRSLKIDRELKNQLSFALSKQNIGEIYVKKKYYKKALSTFITVLEIAKKIKSMDLIKDIQKNISGLFEEQKDYKKALKYYREHIKTKDQLLNKESNNKIIEMQTKYETEKKEKELELLKKNSALQMKNNKIQYLKLSKERIISKAFIIGFGLVLIIMLLLFKKYLNLFAFWKKKNHIGPYRIIEKIGSGGMAVVFKAVHFKDKSKSVAIKLLREDLSLNDLERQRFFNEASIIDKIEHKNIIKIYERGESQKQLFIVMEFLEGKTLAERIKEEANLTENELLLIMNQLTDAIIVLHNKGIIHRDLKPENIMLLMDKNNELKVKLLDFGLAKTQSLQTLTKTGMILGTIYYMPPEQLFQSVFSTAGDIYSLGVIFYEMTTKARPFAGDTTGEIMYEILNKNPESPDSLNLDISRNINKLILQMMNKEPQKRPDIISIKSMLNIH